jgi:hypothetical protein
MQISVIMTWVNRAFDFIVETFLKTKYPGLEKVFANIDRVMEFAAEAVSAAEATAEEGPIKKAMATKSLSGKLIEAGIDIPGDQDELICGLIVEAMVAGLKRFFPAASPAISAKK